MGNTTNWLVYLENWSWQPKLLAIMLLLASTLPKLSIQEILKRNVLRVSLQDYQNTHFTSLDSGKISCQFSTAHLASPDFHVIFSSEKTPDFSLV